MTPLSLLERWIVRRTAGDGASWLRDSLERIGSATTDRDLFARVSLVSRRLGKSDLALSAQDLADAREARSEWNPALWSVDQAGRVAFLLARPAALGAFSNCLDRLCNSADMGELVSFYEGLPLYPGAADDYVARACEGLRSNMKPVYEAVAHRNPFPSERLPEGAWNQMVLKALFIGSTLHPIVGLTKRMNPTLSDMLADYARERWAAGRPISPELWRCVVPCATGRALDAVARALDAGTERERLAIALAAAESGNDAVADLLARRQLSYPADDTAAVNWPALAGG